MIMVGDENVGAKKDIVADSDAERTADVAAVAKANMTANGQLGMKFLPHIVVDTLKPECRLCAKAVTYSGVFPIFKI